MQLDMHFFGVYAMARSAGVNPDAARTIACASQYVDDSIKNRTTILGDKMAVMPHITSHKPTDIENCFSEDQWNVWVPFHFLPGNDEKAETFIERMVCTKNSNPAQRVLKNALQYKTEVFGPHLAGVVAHVFADTFAHYGFAGIEDKFNKVDTNSIRVTVNSGAIKDYIWNKFNKFLGRFARALPVGHGSAATFPDRPYLTWEYEREHETKLGKKVQRNNINDFTEACQELHKFFSEFLDGNEAYRAPSGARIWDSIKDQVQGLIKEEGKEEDRIKNWKKAIASGDLFQTAEGDENIAYSPDEWAEGCTIAHFAKNQNLDTCDTCLFNRAAMKHRSFVLDELLPEIKLLA